MLSVLLPYAPVMPGNSLEGLKMAGGIPNVLICTLFRDSEFYLHNFLNSIGKLIEFSKKNYNIDLCFIEGNSTDNTYQKLERWMSTCSNIALYKHNSSESKYKRLAILRNMALELGLKEYHDYVMMIDSDISFKEDLLQRLVTSLERTDGVMMAPMIYVENTETFHDILAFVKNGINFVNLHPYHESFLKHSGIMEMDSVGDCFLLRAGAISNAKFEGDGHSEQIGFCQNIRKAGGRIYLDKRIVVYHADLPKYGLKWHKI